MDWSLRDVESVAKAKLQQMAFDYAQGGAGLERTLAENVAAFGRYRFRPRFLVDVSKRDLSTELLGRKHPVPFGIAPTAFHRLFHEDGERGVARAARNRGVVHCVSTLATTSLEDVATEGAPRWFQLYVHRDRKLTESLVARAKASGYEALVLTVDAPVWALRERDRRNRFTLPAPLTLANFERYLDKAGGGADGLSNYVNGQLDPSLTWADLAWLKRVSGMPVLVKGILTPEDAALAVEHGAEGIVVSNHGGRMLDHVPATLDALPDIVSAVRGRVPVVLDGGVRGGADVLVALALGASFVLVGRQVVWGLAAGGEAGAARVLDLLREELDNAMALTGRRSVAEIDGTLVARV
ncbi:MAG: 4-hydroxymandelate oxidase [Thermoplasmata archaeon]|nr:4-hydroxymandelate oxidase [Thermoplasmata archaeon]